MKHITINLTEEQRGNLLYLAEYLDTGVTEMPFDMAHFRKDSVCIATSYVCGTSACAVGHGPLIGISAIPGEDWHPYLKRVFSESRHAYNWCFNGNWDDVDNTARGAAARIFYMLKHGVPENVRDQLSKRAPLSYTVNPAPRVDLQDMFKRVSARTACIA